MRFMLEILFQELITLANKARVLLSKEKEDEPRLMVCYNSKGIESITLKSLCFPFFTEYGFITFPATEIQIVLAKCRAYVKKLENEKTFDIVPENPYEKVSRRKKVVLPKKEKPFPSVFIARNGKLIKFYIKPCKYHGKDFKKATRTCGCKVFEEVIG